MDDIRKRMENLERSIASLKRVRTRSVPDLPTDVLEMIRHARSDVRSKRVPRKSQSEKKETIRKLDSIENDIMDLLIISSLSKKKLGVSGIRKAVPASESKIRKQVAALVRNGTLKKSRRGRYVVYFA